MYFTYLPKTGGARMHDVHTVKLCQENKLLGYQSIKSADETGLEEDEFVHVILSQLKHHDFPVIVKIHDADSDFIKRELFFLNKMRDFENSVELICDFSCMDDKKRWMSRVADKSVRFCNNKSDSLHFIVLEYIENGDIGEYLSTASNDQIMSIFLQCTLAIMVMGLKYNTCHGDLNSGNILVDKTDKKRASYKIFNREYRIKTFGIIPKFIDYGRSSSLLKNDYTSIICEIHICFSVLIKYIGSPEMKTKLKTFLNEEVEFYEHNIKKNYLHTFIEKLKNL